MPTYLLAWNSKRWKWDNLPEESDAVMSGKKTVERWSCGRSRRLQIGDRIFLIHLGKYPKGIFGSGSIAKPPKEGKHWDEQKAAAGERCFFVEVEFDTLLDPATDEILPRELLNSPSFSMMHWDTQMSGVRIPDEVAVELEKLWSKYATGGKVWIPEEVEETEGILEGALRRISVNAYERNPEARRKCIHHYGASCSICGFDFGKQYGDAGKDLIHVHHLRQLADIGKEYYIDPINDLRPICPNCHAIIHRRKPAYSIKEVQAFLQDKKGK